MTTVVLNAVTRKVEVFSSARDVQARAEIADHKSAADPHPQYLADADLAGVALSGDAGDLIAGTVPDARMPNWTGYNLASRTALEAANVPAAVVGLRLLGHAAAGDGGGALYQRVAAEPSHDGKIQSGDGAWWEIAEADIDIRMLGAVADANSGTAIQNAINVVQALGRSLVWVPAATFLVDAQISLKSKVAIVGVGKGASILKAADSLDAVMLNGSSISNFAVRDITLDGNKANQTAGNGIVLTDCTDFHVSVEAKDVSSNAILLDDDCARFVVAHCLVKDSGLHAIALSGDAGASGTGDDATGKRCSDGVIANNVIRSPGQSGINVSEATRVTVSGNTVYHDGTPSGGYGGIRITNSATEIAVTGNTVRGMPRGIFLAEGSDCTISGNVLAGSRLQGILLSDDVTQSDNNVITGNRIMEPGLDGTAGSTAGIQIRNATGNFVSGNTISDAGSTMEHGILEDGTSSGNMFGPNKVSGATSADYSLVSDGVVDQGYRVSRANNAVNFPELRSAATSGIIELNAYGSDANIPAAVNAKGTQTARLGNSGGYHLHVGNSVTVANYVLVGGQAAGSPPAIQSLGSDTNVDLRFVPKGTGVMRFGTHAALSGETVSGYIEIKDNGGTVRKIAVVS